MERFIVQPSIQYFGGIEIKEDTEFTEATDNGEVKQTFKDGILTTKIKKEHEHLGMKTVETTKLVQNIPVGMRLMWGKEEGYIISPYKMVRVDEAIEELKVIKE